MGWQKFSQSVGISKNTLIGWLGTFYKVLIQAFAVLKFF